MSFLLRCGAVANVSANPRHGWEVIARRQVQSLIRFSAR